MAYSTRTTFPVASSTSSTDACLRPRPARTPRTRSTPSTRRSGTAISTFPSESLNVVQIRVPPLREHKEDIDDIADHWWFGRLRKHLAPQQIVALKEYDYPGNVRELMNLLERALVLGENDFARLVARHREMNAGLEEEESCSLNGNVPDLLDDAIREHVRRVLRKYALNVTRAASALGISRTTLRKWI